MTDLTPCGYCHHPVTEHDIAPRDYLIEQGKDPGGYGACGHKFCSCKSFVIKGFETEAKMNPEKPEDSPGEVVEVKKELTIEQLQTMFEASIQLMDSAVQDIQTAWRGICIVLMSSQIVPPKEEPNGGTKSESPDS